MAYTFQDICNTKANGTGRDVADLLGIQYPADSTVSKDLFLMTAGNRAARQAAEEVANGNGHGLYGEKRRTRNGNGGGNGGGKAAPDRLYAIDDEEVVMAARLACRKAGISPTGEAVREAIESGIESFVRSIDANLSPEQRATLETAVGVLTPAEREKLKREELIAGIRMAVLKAAKYDSMRRELESAGFAVESPAWFTRCAAIDISNLATNSTAELNRISASINSPTWSDFIKSRAILATIR